MKTGVSVGGACRFTRSMPGRNHHAPGTGGDESTGTDFPTGSSARASASADPSVSPSASLCVTAVTTGASSITCQIRGARSATSGRGGASSAAGVWLPLNFTEQLADLDAVGDPLIELEMQVGGEAQVRKTGPELPTDEPLRVIEAVDGSLPGVCLPNHADLHGRVPQVRTELHLADRRHPDSRVFEVTDDDLADFLAQLCGDAFNSMSAHALIVLALPPLPACRPSRVPDDLFGTGHDRWVSMSTRSASKPKAVCSTWG